MTPFVSRERNAYALLLLVGVVALTSFGCTSRKQYAINEAILISERRQLEDEIYRSKFELRDALRENERLRAQLEKEGINGSEKRKQGTSAKSYTSESDFFPGGSALRVDPSKIAPSYQNGLDPDQYDASPTQGVETLPDFVPVPSSAKTRSRYSQTNAGTKVRQASASEPAGKEYGTRRRVVVDDESNEPQDASDVPNESDDVEDSSLDWAPLG